MGACFAFSLACGIGNPAMFKSTTLRPNGNFDIELSGTAAEFAAVLPELLKGPFPERTKKQMWKDLATVIARLKACDKEIAKRTRLLEKSRN